MIRLIVKDIFMLQKRNLFLLPFFAAYMVIMSVSTTMGAYDTAAGVLPGMISLSLLGIVMVAQASFGFDEQTKFDTYLRALPISKKHIVAARYLTCAVSALMGVAWFLIVVLAARVISVLTGAFEFRANIPLFSLVMWIPPAAFAAAVFVPLLYKFGYMKARYLLTFLMAATIATMPVISQTVTKISPQTISNTLASVSPALLYLLIAAVTALAVSISMSISVAIYSKKEM